MCACSLVWRASGARKDASMDSCSAVSAVTHLHIVHFASTRQLKVRTAVSHSWAHIMLVVKA